MIDRPLYAPCQKDIEWANRMLDAVSSQTWTIRIDI